MPRVETPKHSVRVQRAYAPLLFRARFRPEQLLTPPPLPWRITFPPHTDDPAVDDNDNVVGGSSASQVKMKRPNGEPGRSGDRGFNLKSTLDLPGRMYEELLDEVHRLALAHLNVARTITNQSQDALEQTYKTLKEKFPILEERFEGDWPAKAMIQNYLKNTSVKSSTSKSKS